MGRNRMQAAFNGLFNNRGNGAILPNPANEAAPFFWTAGPVFNPGAAGAVYNSKLSKGWQVIGGYAYPVANPQKFTPNQETGPLYAQNAVSVVGINIQTGWTGVTSPATNSDGSFVPGYSPNFDAGAASQVPNTE